METYYCPDLTDEEKRVLGAVGDDLVNTLDAMAQESGVPIKRLRSVLKALIRLDLVHFGTCYHSDDERLRCGSGYSRTYLGSKIAWNMSL